MTTEDKKQRVVSELTKLVLSADDEVFREIAKFDSHGGGGVTYEEACELHYQGLKEVLDGGPIQFNWERHHWYPLEAIELCAHPHGSSDSFGVATAILMIDELSGGEQGYFDSLGSSDRYIQAYKALPEKFSAPILAGIELLEEEWTRPDEP